MDGTLAELQSLQTRLKRLTRLTLALAIVVVALAAAWATVASRERGEMPGTQGVIEARGFLVRDEGGTARARLDGRGLAILDERGTARAWLMLADGTARLILYGTDRSQLQIAAADDGIAGIYLFDREMKQRARLSLQENDTVGLTLFDRNYVWRAIMGVTSEGFSSFTLFDGKGKTIARLPPEVRPAETPRAE